MKLLPQYKLRTLLAITVVVAIVLAMLRPFDPEIIFLDAHAATFVDRDSKFTPAISISFSNNGRISVWYPEIRDRECIADIMSIPYNGTPERIYEVMGDANLKKIRPGERATICIPLDAKDTMLIMPNDTMLKVGVHFSDWRGRIAVRFSDPVNPGDFAN